MGNSLDIELNYEEGGIGEYLILLHGNGESKEYFVHQMEFFKTKYHVIALDTRGHGGSPRGCGEFSISRFSDDLFCFMCDKGIEKANILGFSDGGNIALTFALRHPKMVNKLILNGANLYPRGVKNIYQFPVELVYNICKWLPKCRCLSNIIDLFGLMVNEPNINPYELNSLHIPTLVIVGSRDMIKEEHTRLIAGSLPEARLAILEGDHFIAEKHPEKFNNVVYEFLQC